ncbi:MAG: type 1 glutamine amidotransferase [Peptococcaceae bacterium]
MKIHYLQHVHFEDAANIGIWTAEKGHQMTGTRLFAGERLPSAEEYDWLVVMGGPMNIYEENKYPWLTQEKRFIEKAIKENKIVLGICLGAQLIADVLGGQVVHNQYKEIGWFPVSLTEAAANRPKNYSLPESFMAFHWHGDTFEMPRGCTRLAESEGCANQAFAYRDHVFGLQFHLESSPASVANLLRNCSDEIVPGKYIQETGAILGQNYFAEIYKTMTLFLNNIAG